MVINQATLQGIYKSFRTIFQEAFQAAQPQYTKVATVVPSSTKEEEYKWLGRFPRLREWVGDRVVQNLAAHGWTIRNKSWEATIEVDRDDIEDDTIGVYRPLVEQLGIAAATHPDEIVFQLLADGFTNTCYDGQYFFDTDHPGPGGSSQSNKGTAVLSADAYADARAAMMAITDENGNPLKITPNLLVVPPQLEATARQILHAETISGTTNVWRNSADLLVVPELASHPTYWFLLDVSKPIKPLIFQQRKAPNFVQLTSETDENVFMRKTFLYGVDTRDNAGYALWQLAYGSTGGA